MPRKTVTRKEQPMKKESPKENANEYMLQFTVKEISDKTFNVSSEEITNIGEKCLSEIEECKENILNNNVTNSQETESTSADIKDYKNKDVQDKQNNDSNKDLIEVVLNNSLNENVIESNLDKDRLNNVEIISENSGVKKKNEALVKQTKKQIKNMKANDKIQGDASENVKNVGISSRTRKKEVIKESEDSLLTDSVANAQEVATSTNVRKQKNNHGQDEENNESIMNSHEQVLNDNLNENAIQSNLDKDRLDNVEMVSENSGVKRKNVNEALMKQTKKQIKSMKVNNKTEKDASENVKNIGISSRTRRKDIIKESEDNALAGSVANAEEVASSTNVRKKKNNNVEDKQNNESSKNLHEQVSNNENNIESSVDKDKLENVERIPENSGGKRKQNVVEAPNEQNKKQVKNTKTKSKNVKVASEKAKPVNKKVQEKDGINNDADETDDFVTDKRVTLRKRGKKEQINTNVKTITENKNASKKNLKKSTQDSDLVHSTIKETDVKSRKRKNKKENESNDEPEIKHTKSENESSDEGAALTKQINVVVDHEKSKKTNKNDDIIVSLKNGKGKASTKHKKEKDDEDKSSKKAKTEKDSKQPSTSKASSKKEKIPDVTSIDFSNDSKSSSGNPWNLKISSWNINGIRAWLEKNGLSFLHHEKPDVMCLQETKCSDDKLPEEVKKVEGYHAYWLSGDKDGYSGVGLLSKEEPQHVEYGIGISEHDNEGRVITAEYDKFYVVAVYVPNAGRGLVRLDYRMKWDEDFRAYLKKLDEKKPVILCGDLNVAHEEIDLANPKTNKKNAGFTKEEREGFSTLLSEGFIDTFRSLYPDVVGAYTFWTYMMNARAKNVGWRLDYFVISKRFDENLCDSVIRKDVFGSDHCPVTLFLSV